MYRPLAAGSIYPSSSAERQFPLVGLSSKQLAAARIRPVSRGETICEPGMPEIVGYVIKGTVKLVTFLPDGRTNIVGVIEAPGFFGRIFGISAEFAIEAATDVIVACFDRAAFEVRLSDSPALEHLIHIENLCQLEEAHERITVLACQSMIERLAMYMVLRLLTTEARSGGRSSSAPEIHVPINRRDFAAYLGTTVETVSRNIQALVRRGTIAVIDSANFRLLRRSDLFSIAGQHEEDLLDMVRSRAPAMLEKAKLFRTRQAADNGAAYLIAAE